MSRDELVALQVPDGEQNELDSLKTPKDVPALGNNDAERKKLPSAGVLAKADNQPTVPQVLKKRKPDDLHIARKKPARSITGK
jgi:hypothetical protein